MLCCIALSRILLLLGRKQGLEPLKVSEACMSLLSSVGLGWLSLKEHRLSSKPPSGIALFLLAAMFCDVAELTMPCLGSTASKWALAPSLLARCALLRLESQCRDKRKASCGTANRAPEEYVGILSRTFFWWLNAILARGNTALLGPEHMPPLDGKLAPIKLRRSIVRCWDLRGSCAYNSKIHCSRGDGV